jgi:hypothetical protein
MNKTALRILVFVFIVSLAIVTVALAQDEEKLFRVDIRNNTDQLVTMVLIGDTDLPTYVLNVPAGTDELFTVQEGVYAHTTFACDETAEGTLNVRLQLRFNFTPCFGDAPNAGEPSMEKINIPDTPDGIMWLFQYE